MDKLLSALPADGSELEFTVFMAAARAAGARAELWRAAKLQGLITARIDENGVHLVRRVIAA